MPFFWPLKKALGSRLNTATIACPTFATHTHTYTHTHTHTHRGHRRSPLLTHLIPVQLLCQQSRRHSCFMWRLAAKAVLKISFHKSLNAVSQSLPTEPDLFRCHLGQHDGVGPNRALSFSASAPNCMPLHSSGVANNYCRLEPCRRVQFITNCRQHYTLPLEVQHYYKSQH